MIGALSGPPVWIVLGLATYAFNTRSGNLARAAAAESAGSAPVVTRFARPAKIVALTILPANVKLVAVSLASRENAGIYNSLVWIC